MLKYIISLIMNKKILIILLIIIILIILYLKDDRIDMPKHTITKYNNILSEQTLELFKDYNFIKGGIYGDMIVDIFEYGKNEMISYNKYKGKVSDFIENNNKNVEKKQISLYLNNHPEFNKVLNLIKKDLSKFYEIDNNVKFKLRLSSTPWNWGAHFDCTNGKLLQLFNQRIVATLDYDLNNDYDTNITKSSISDLEKKYKNVNKTILNAGDLIEIPMGITHSIEGYNVSKKNRDFSIALSFNLDKKSNPNCENYFTKYFKPRREELNNGII